ESAPGTGPYRYHAATAGSGWRAIIPPSSTPRGTNGMSIPRSATTSRFGWTDVGSASPSTAGLAGTGLDVRVGVGADETGAADPDGSPAAGGVARGGGGVSTATGAGWSPWSGLGVASPQPVSAVAAKTAE